MRWVLRKWDGQAALRTRSKCSQLPLRSGEPHGCALHGKLTCWRGKGTPGRWLWLRPACLPNPSLVLFLCITCPRPIRPRPRRCHAVTPLLLPRPMPRPLRTSPPPHTHTRGRPLPWPGVVHWQSPNFFAYFAANSSFPGMLAEMLMTATNMIGFSWAASPVRRAPAPPRPCTPASAWGSAPGSGSARLLFPHVRQMQEEGGGGGSKGGQGSAKRWGGRGHAGRGRWSMQFRLGKRRSAREWW